MKIFKRRKKQNEEKQEEERVEMVDFETNEITPFSDSVLPKTEYITQKEFEKKINEIEGELEIIKQSVNFLLSKGVSNVEGKSDSREPVQEDNTATTDDNKEAIQKPHRGQRQKNSLHNSPEQVVLP